MAERSFPGFTLRSSATRDGSRFKALISSHPVASGFPSYFTVYDNRSFREESVAAEAAEKALGLVLEVDEEGTPVFAEGETGFDDDRPGAGPGEEGDEDDGENEDDEDEDEDEGKD